ncbi:hypothetical protein HY440_01985 [Candidatus Microgenomates bacterium]|nr:hypothetical protein [Candidatus Microgenomates bacterium]
MIEINLLPPRNVLSRREASIRAKMVGFLTVATVILLLDLGIFFGVSKILTRQVSGQVATRSSLLAEAESLSPIADSLRTVENKAVGIAAILATRPNMAAAVTEIDSLSLPNLEIGNFQIGNTGAFSFSARAGDAASLGSFIDKISSEVSAGRLTGVTMQALHQDGAGFSFNISASYLFGNQAK